MNEMVVDRVAKDRRARTNRGNPPRCITPAADARVDAHAVAFEWDGGDGRDFTLEVATDENFQTVVARVPTGDSTSVTVYDVFRPDETRFFWRVLSASTPAGECQSFVAASYLDLSASPSKPSKAASSTQSGSALSTPPPPEAVEPPYRIGVTRPMAARVIVALMLLSFIITMGILYSVTSRGG